MGNYAGSTALTLGASSSEGLAPFIPFCPPTLPSMHKHRIVMSSTTPYASMKYYAILDATQTDHFQT